MLALFILAAGELVKMQTPWATFDCFGTLVDWHAGFAAILEPMLGSRTADVIRAYHEFERSLETEKPHRLYKDVLTTALLRAASSVGADLSEAEARELPRQWASLPVFGDVEEMLARLRITGCRLGVLTNCDNDLFEQTHRAFLRRFDFIVTAEQVRDYKPSPTHFEFFSRSSGVRPHEWVHVACSQYHDIEPACALGIKSIWLDRDQNGGEPAATFIKTVTTRQVCEAVPRLFEMEGG